MKLSDLSKLQYVEVGQIMVNTDVESSILVTEKVSYAVELIAKSQPGSALVVLNLEGVITGIITEKDIIIALHRLGLNALDAEVKDIMTEAPTICEADDTCEKVLMSMISGNYRNMPIVKDKLFSGIVQLLEVSGVKMSKLMEENSKLKKLVKQLLPPELIFSPEDDIEKAKAFMNNNDFPCVIVEDKNKIEAVITDKDFLKMKTETKSDQNSAARLNKT